MGDLPKHYVYILRSCQHPQRHYVGLTADLATRLNTHNAGQVLHTARHRPWRFVAALWLPNERRAVAFEQYLKTGSGRAFAKRHFG